MKIILPFRLPTWNQLLAMDRWQRKEVRDCIKNAVLMCCQRLTASQMRMDAVLKLSWTDLEKQAYLKMITPKSSLTYRIRKKRLHPARMKKQ